MSTADQREEVQRILRSAQFRRAPKLQRFLELVCDYHSQGRSAEINEFAIATQAFGKGPDFDPSGDSLVRVQAREIRRRLREYYQSEGKASRLILDIPIGHYAPVFTSLRRGPDRAVGAFAALGLVDSHRHRAGVCSPADRGRPRATPINEHGFCCRPQHRSQCADRRTVEPLPRFRRADAAGGDNPDVGECAAQKQGATGCPDEYTGMGEAVAIHLITALFRPAKQTLIVKPSRIVNADDIQRYNLILVGGKSVNIWTPRLGEDLSLDEPNPPQQYETVLDANTGQISRDRAIVALRKHPATGRWVLFLWGKHSQGTHAAAEASTDERFLAQLKWPTGACPESFHVLVGVNVNDGIPQRPEPVAVRVP